jgi:hypothetical protein
MCQWSIGHYQASCSYAIAWFPTSDIPEKVIANLSKTQIFSDSSFNSTLIEYCYGHLTISLLRVTKANTKTN